MRPTLLLSALSALSGAAILGLLPAPAVAQAHASRDTGATRVIARYDFGITRGAVVFPSTVFVTDSAGRLGASARMPGQSRLRPMSVTVLESDLVLQAETPDGVLTLVFDKQAEGGDPRKVTGSWAVGRERGTLRARAAG